MTLLYTTPLGLIALVLSALTLAATEVGVRFGRRHSVAGAGESVIGIMQGALLALLGLLLAFTFGMANARFETRKQLVVSEANDIGTASLRTDMLRDPWRSNSQELLVEYVRERVRFYSKPDEATDGVALRTFLASASSHHARLWEQAVGAAARDPHDHMTALYVDALNAVIDSHSARVTAARNHVPETTLILLVILAIGCSMSVGHSCGSAGRRHFGSTTAFNLLIVIVIVVIMDLDRPLRGFIEVSQTPLIELLADLERPPK